MTAEDYIDRNYDALEKFYNSRPIYYRFTGIDEVIIHFPSGVSIAITERNFNYIVDNYSPKPKQQPKEIEWI